VESIAAAIAQHGYSLLFFVVLAESIGFPIPAAVGLLVAGGASAKGPLNAGHALLMAYWAMMIGDNILFVAGRYTGWGLLGLLCRLSLNPEACVMKSADQFYKRGRIILLFAKFLPGISTMVAPLSGSMGMPYWQFFGLDFIGSSVYILTYFGVGYLFSDFLSAIMRGYSTAGSYAGWTIGLLILVWLGNRIRLCWLERRQSPVPRLTPLEVAARENVEIYDVRSHGYYDQNAMRIKGSLRLEPNALSEQWANLPRDREIVVYCTCLREATAEKVARELAQHGIPSAVIDGGLNAWKKASLPLEAVPAGEMVMLPKFS
jgi:membrane protein DedA with SNARE-associated domain/rhodanese-related sulfurtransferase